MSYEMPSPAPMQSPELDAPHQTNADAYFHGSTHQFELGDKVLPGRYALIDENDVLYASATTEEEIAWVYTDHAETYGTERGRVYRVEPSNGHNLKDFGEADKKEVNSPAFTVVEQIDIQPGRQGTFPEIDWTKYHQHGRNSFANHPKELRLTIKTQSSENNETPGVNDAAIPELDYLKLEQIVSPPELSEDLQQRLHAPIPDAARALHPDGLAPQPTLAETIRVLHRLPHIAATPEQMTYPGNGSSSQLVRGVQIPMSRIVGVATFDSWAGRGLDSNKRANQVGTYSSAGTIHYYSHKPETPGYVPSVSLFKDSDGEVWAATSIDGSHRTAAAKLKGQDELLCDVYAYDYDDLPKLDASVAEMVSKQDKALTGFIGRTIMRRQTKLLISASEQVEAAAEARRNEPFENWI